VEREIGEIFELEGEKYTVEEGKTCDGCSLDRGEYCLAYSEGLREITGKCSCFSRKNKKSVIFVKIVD
jgi:hypothetical protein